MDTYKERVFRYRILRHDELPESHKEEYRKSGINPDEIWSLVWSFNDLKCAEEALLDCNLQKAVWQTYKLVDAGEETVIERPLY